MKENKRPILFDKGPFRKLFLDFIYYKRGCGLKYEDSVEYTLRIINRCLNGYGLEKPVLTKTMIEELAKKRSHETYATQSKRITFLRQFARFLKNMGIEAYIYPDITSTMRAVLLYRISLALKRLLIYSGKRITCLH